MYIRSSIKGIMYTYMCNYVYNNQGGYLYIYIGLLGTIALFLIQRNSSALVGR